MSLFRNSICPLFELQVQSLALDLGLDRTEVLAFVADFRAKPKQEQARLLAPLQQQIKQQQQQQQQKQQQRTQRQEATAAAAADPFWAAPSSSSGADAAAAAAAAAAVPATLPFSERNPNTGYVPFAARRDAAAAGGRKGRRLPAEVLRTLEGVYGRSPWPSKEVVAGLFDLHRLPRWVLVIFYMMFIRFVIFHVSFERVYGRSPWPSKEVVAGLFDLHRLPRWVLICTYCMQVIFAVVEQGAQNANCKGLQCMQCTVVMFPVRWVLGKAMHICTRFAAVGLLRVHWLRQAQAADRYNVCTLSVAL
jgi:hypothetical protein